MKRLIGAGIVALALVGLAPTAQADTGYNRDTVAQFIATVNATAAKYGTGPVAVYVDNIGSSENIAQTTEAGITINSYWAAVSPASFNAAIAEDVRVGYTPGGCAGIQATAIHEVGHVIDRRGGRAARQAVNVAASTGQITTSGLHSYAFEDGAINPGEAVAISFTAVECGSATATERAIYNVLVS